MTKNPLFYGVLLLVLAVFVTQCCFTVHQTQQALVLQLGDPLPEIYRPGLHFKLPFIQKVVYFDARVLDYAASSREAFTVDKKTIVLDNYARWRISDPLQFYRTMRTIPGAQARLDDVVYSQLRALVGAYTLTEVVSKERATIMARVTEKVSDLMKPYGVEVLDVRIKRTDLPTENQRSIFDRMRAERERQAKQYRSEGQEQATRIRSDADRQKALILAEPPSMPRPTARHRSSIPISAGSRPCASPSRRTANWCWTARGRCWICRSRWIMGFTEIYERIKLAANCRTQVELAELLNIRQSSISDAKRRDSVPGDWYMKLFERFGLNPDWLKYGVGPLYLRTEKGYCPQEAPQALAETVACYGGDFTRSTVVDVYDMACAYTDEDPRPALSVAGRVPLPQAFLRPSLQVLRLRGRAMEPLLREGAYIGVDMEDPAPVSGRTYALFAPLEGVVVRQVFLDGPQQGYVLRAQSPDYPETSLDAALLQRRMLGRVVWTFQEV